MATRRASDDEATTDMSVQASPPEDRDSVPSSAAAVSPGGASAKLTPGAWAEILFPDSASGRMHDDAWKHAAAASLHGWIEFEHHNGKGPMFDKETYLAALAAASGNKFQPHGPADCRKKA